MMMTGGKVVWRQKGREKDVFEGGGWFEGVSHEEAN